LAILKTHFLTFGLALCAALVCNLASAKDGGNSLQWLSADQEKSLSDSVPPPPVPNSPEDQADVAAVVAAEKARTPEIIAECKQYQKFSAKLFESIYGKDLTPDKYPKFNQLLQNIEATTKVVNDAAKDKYKRPRPYVGHPDQVKSLFEVTGFSYPSGHSMGSFTIAVVLGTVFPDKQQALLDLAAKIAQSRVNAGVHHPVDIKEGEALGRATGAAIVATPAFQADLAAVQAELKK
jgi:acid phosphatase (class A)